MEEAVNSSEKEGEGMGLKPLDSFFSPAVRRKGITLFHAEDVEMDHLNEFVVRAFVTDTEYCCVRLAWYFERHLGVDCDCDQAQEGFLCQHIWAVILTVNGLPQFELPSKVNSLVWLNEEEIELIDNECDGESDDDSDDDSDDEAGEEAGEETDDRFGRSEQRKKSNANVSQSAAPARIESEQGSPVNLHGSTVIEAEFRQKSGMPDASLGPLLDERELGNLLGPLAEFGKRQQKTGLIKSRPKTQLIYSLSVDRSEFQFEPRLRLYFREPGNDSLRQLTPNRPAYNLELGLEPEDKRLLQIIRDFNNKRNHWYSQHEYFSIDQVRLELILPELIATGRFGLSPKPHRDPSDLNFRIIRHLDDRDWQTKIAVHEDPSGTAWQVHGRLWNAESATSLTDDFLIAFGQVFQADRYLRLPETQGKLLQHLLERQLRVPKRNTAQFRKFLYERLPLEALELPPALQLREAVIPPQGALRLEKQASFWRGEVGVQYQDNFVPLASPLQLVFDPYSDQYFPRDIPREVEIHGDVVELVTENLARISAGQDLLQVNAGNLLKVVHRMLDKGWAVSVAKEKIRQGGEFRIDISSGIDWFDLSGQMEFGDEVLPLPEILERLEDNGFVRLENGALGILPDDWQQKFAAILKLGKTQENSIRFKQSQAFLLDAMLAEREFVSFDKTFAKFRERIRQFDGIEPRAVCPSFQGELRPYQLEGHNWLHFLRDFGLGGCLADDMGLGKTVQVLAMLDTWRQDRKRKKKQPEHRPSLLVVPKSLIFNWQAEAAKFAPRLRVLDFSGIGREALRDQIAESDVVLTTYGTLRRDIAWLNEIEFDYAILDEAQAIKNSDSQTAKATRLIRAEHRLALSGTPVENRLSDLWSIFEFLNPGMLGSSQAFAELGNEGEKESLERLSKALRPLLLRRTKQQVLKDLPEKTEQTLFCEMEGRQREIYDEVADFYRQSLLKKVKKEGIKKSKIHVLEALLRLRQIACHPALVNLDITAKKARAKSAKFEVLLEQLESVISEGHKALVFSQFTSLLALLKPELEKRKIKFEYLDGGTRDRKACVERFNKSDNIPLFLLSLKAGGHGLNLTSADYVFILDPWWNPAVEAQAIDRAHRIGQQRHVFGYRLIAMDTI
jgi:hypothetical protein